MSFPGIDITIANGQLGGLAQTADGIVGMIVSCAAAPAGMTLGVAKQYTRLSVIEADGLDAAFDVAQDTNAHAQLVDVYTMNPDAVCWIMPVVNTATMEEICDKTENPCYALELVKASDYAVKAVGVCRLPDAAYVATVVNGLDDDVIAAAIKAQSLAIDLIKQGTPVAFIIEGRSYQGDAGDLLDLKTCDYNHVGIIICGISDTDESASVGLVIGDISILPVQRNIGRVKSGSLPLTAAYLSDGTSVILHPDLESIHNKGYITIRKFLTRSGFYFTDDPTATADTDDFCTISRRRTINKAVRIAAETYTNEINDEIDIADDGTIQPYAAKALQTVLETQIKGSMKGTGENDNISGPNRDIVFVDPAQNVLSTNKTVARIRIIPKGQNKTIGADLGFSNPANS